MTAAKYDTKKPSPRSVLDTIRSWTASPRVSPKEASVTLNQSYVTLDDEVRVHWKGSSEKSAQNVQKREKKKEVVKKRVSPRPATPRDSWIVDKIKFLSLKGLIDKATQADSYELVKNKHIDKIVNLCKDPDGAKSVCRYLDQILKHCSKGSLTNAEYAVKIMKCCYVLHCIMKKGTAQAYQNVIGNYPYIFDLPQIALPKSIPASCVEARMAISYAAFLNLRVRLRQQDSLEALESKSQVFSNYGSMKVINVMDLFEKGVSCRFYRKRDSSTFFPRDTIHWFQLHIISDLIAQVDRLNEEGNLLDPNSDAERVILGRKKQLVAWSERMQASRFMADSEYFQLKAIDKSITPRNLREAQTANTANQSYQINTSLIMI